MHRPLTMVNRVLMAAGLAVVALPGLAGCGSEEKGTRTPNENQEIRDPKDRGATDASFCTAVDDVRKAQEAGDNTAMADSLRLLLDDLPDELADQVQTYIDGLEASPHNDRPAADSVENPEAQQAFEDYAQERCGASGAGTSTTSGETTTAPAG